MIERGTRDYGRLFQRVVERMFPDRAVRLEALGALEQYGVGSDEPEPERVRLAIVKLAGANIEEIRSIVAGAKEDYEDILCWAESPQETRCRIGNRKLAPHEWQEIVAEDRRQYEEWVEDQPTKVI
jgi:hypothetical protein